MDRKFTEACQAGGRGSSPLAPARNADRSLNCLDVSIGNNALFEPAKRERSFHTQSLCIAVVEPFSSARPRVHVSRTLSLPKGGMPKAVGNQLTASANATRY